MRSALTMLCRWWNENLLLIAQLARQLSRLFGLGSAVGRYRGAASFLLNKLSQKLASVAAAGLLEPPKAFAERLPIIPLVDDKPRPQLSSNGVRVIGFARRQFGLGVGVRNYLNALMTAGIPVEYFEPDIDIPHGRSDYLAEDFAKPEHVIATIFFIGPHLFEQVLSKIPEKQEGELWIGCWFWELEGVPAEWAWAIDQVDALMVASEFIAEAFRKSTSKPIIKVPIPIQMPDIDSVELNISTSDFKFVTMFDFHSSVYRKNPIDTIRAFMKAFPLGDEHVSLTIKTSNAVDFPGDLRRVFRSARKDRRISIVDVLLDRPRQIGLLASHDAFVSLHRSEGFGLAMAEAMACAKPVIATDWSGNREFMGRDDSRLVDCTMIPVSPHEYPHSSGANWAAPNVDEAAGYMRALVFDPSSGASLGSNARNRIAEQLDANAIALTMWAEIMRLRLNGNHLRTTP